MSDSSVDPPATTMGFLLTEGFSLMSYAAIVEPFRAANVLAQTTLYAWQHITLAGDMVRASNGVRMLADQSVGTHAEFDIVFVFAAGDPAKVEDRALFAWLRRLAARGVRLAGVSGGPYVLAAAQVLDGHSATIHWDHQLAFAERFPQVALDPGLYVIDRRRLTCAGGTAGLDLAVELIEREHGHALASRVGEWFIRTEHRAADRPQRLGLRERRGLRDDRVLRVVAQMEASVEEPVTRQVLARLVGLSVRQLERMFRAQVGQGMHELYLSIRLDQASELLRNTAMPVTQIALACGFSNSGHFTTAFKRAFGDTPRGWRKSR